MDSFVDSGINKPIAVNQAIEFGVLVIPKESFCGNKNNRHIAGLEQQPISAVALMVFHYCDAMPD